VRTFIALDIDDAIRERIERFMEGVREFAPDVRWVKPESLHVTLKFVGEKPQETVEQIQAELAKVRGNSFPISFRGHGFFPAAKSARVFWVGIDAGPSLIHLASCIDDATAALGIEKEDRAFSPHLTLARGGSGTPRRHKDDKANRRFEKLQEKLAASPAPDFGSMTAREFFLYESHLPANERGIRAVRYTKIARFELKA
jgi:2'-5' RNA ligase